MAEFKLGTVSHAIMRPEDLLPAFMESLLDLGGQIPNDLECPKHLEYHNYPANVFNVVDEDDPFWQSEDVQWDMEVLFDALQELCPPFVTFGAHPGDGSDFGFWPDIDSLEEAISWAKQDDSDPSEEGVYLEDENLFAQISDHGNVTLYTANREVIWSCV